MKWYKVCIESDTDNTEEASMALLEVGATGTQIQNPDEIKSLIKAIDSKEMADYSEFSDILNKYKTTAYFSVDDNIHALLDNIKNKIKNTEINWSEVDDVEWKDNWKKYYSSFKITRKIKVVPSWEIDGKTEINSIIMDPGMAFGTGTHETTRLCAGLVEKHTFRGCTMLDIGTGTGILSIVASICGAERITAIDTDTAAVKTALKNMVINEITNVDVIKGELKDVNSNCKFDLIAMNIVSDVIMSLLGPIKNHLNNGGKLVCSGIIAEREEEVKKALEDNGFLLMEILHDNDWTAIAATEKA